VPKAATVHVKNGWLPRDSHGWRINSIGGFTWPKRWYSIVVLSTDNPSMSYGITTVESIARVVHRDLNRRSRTRSRRPPPTLPAASLRADRFLDAAQGLVRGDLRQPLRTN
jgi:hypothetical protein